MNHTEPYITKEVRTWLNRALKQAWNHCLVLRSYRQTLNVYNTVYYTHSQAQQPDEQ